ncbi:DUF2171 domain-containing protein [Limnoglobus roseus]|uniref:DUF2171 domain-containing protein n=1 Tax=Limnoglobus roseus TaxID=2598579 RepID=A0A5C1A3H6_9BACT|nr:DUF2171 domain-containing protein [Limnoglobus roseus]QEL13629.1 hypothetical protein PX52LOC_00487 [Limnoglobus roseus]
MSVLANAYLAVAVTAESAFDFLKQTTGLGEPSTGPDFGVSGIRPGMDVISACGQRVGVVDRLDGTSIQLARRESLDGCHHFIPVGWVERVDDQVHLTRSWADVGQNWQPVSDTKEHAI